MDDCCEHGSWFLNRCVEYHIKVAGWARGRSIPIYMESVYKYMLRQQDTPVGAIHPVYSFDISLG